MSMHRSATIAAALSSVAVTGVIALSSPVLAHDGGHHHGECDHHGERDCGYVRYDSHRHRGSHERFEHYQRPVYGPVIEHPGPDGGGPSSSGGSPRPDQAK